MYAMNTCIMHYWKVLVYKWLFGSLGYMNVQYNECVYGLRCEHVDTAGVGECVCVGERVCVCV